MVTFAADTSQDRAQLILFDGTKVLGEEVWEKSKSHSEKMTLAFASLLKSCRVEASQISKIICVNGPGSFTGLRVGVNFCRTLAYSLSSPIVAINTLDLLALGGLGAGLPVMAVLDAQKNSVFLSHYNENLQTLSKNLVVPISDVQKILKVPTLVFGDGLAIYDSVLSTELKALIKIQPLNHQSNLKNLLKKNDLIRLEPAQNWNQLLPVYLKKSAPEELLNPTLSAKP